MSGDPNRCPHCGGRLVFQGWSQHIHEGKAERVAVGRCKDCRRSIMQLQRKVRNAH